MAAWRTVEREAQCARSLSLARRKAKSRARRNASHVDVARIFGYVETPCLVLELYDVERSKETPVLCRTTSTPGKTDSAGVQTPAVTPRQNKCCMTGQQAANLESYHGCLLFSPFLAAADRGALLRGMTDMGG